MASIFTPCEGGVFAVSSNTCGNSPTDSFLVIEDPDFGAMKVPVTGFELDISTSHQFLHTLDKFIYVYAFGDRVGTCTFSGIGFTDCPTTSGGSTPAGVYEYYLNNRLSAGTIAGGGKLTATNIAMPGGRVLLGFLTGLKTSMPNPAYPIVQWALQYHVIISDQSSNNSLVLTDPNTGTYFAPAGPGGAGSVGP